MYSYHSLSRENITYNGLFNDISFTGKKIKTSTDTNITPFETEIANRRDQACRSILVQVNSPSSHEDLQDYCRQFGMIQNIYHYKTNKHHVCQLYLYFIYNYSDNLQFFMYR